MKKSKTFRGLNNFCSTIFVALFSPNRLFKRLIIISFLGFLIYFVSACSFYKVASSAYPASTEIASLSSMNKRFVVHSNTGVFVLNRTSIKNDSLTGTFYDDYIFPSDRTKFPDVNSSNRYKKKRGDSRILNEVHLYVQNVTESIRMGSTYRAVLIDDIYRIDIYDHDKNATTVSWVIGIVAGIVAIPVAFFALLGILTLIGASCPYIYVNTGDGYAFAGEIYSGAIYAPLERNDYLTLPALIAEDGYYRLKMSNELEEIQYTNLTELIVIDHPANTEVLIDKYGNYQTATDLKTPLTASNLTGTDVLDYVNNKDSICYYGVSDTSELPLTDGIILTFDKPENAYSAKLFLRARNSAWLEYVYKNTHELLGNYNDNWNRKQNSADSAKLKEWSLSQKLPLSVYLLKNGEWVFCDYFNLAGPAALKEDVIAIDVKEVDGPLTIKLESGSFFWEIDYAGIDFSPNIPVKVAQSAIEKAVTNEEELVTDQLKYDDLKYYVQPNNYNIADLSFRVPPVSDTERTVILHSKGYYNILNQSNKLPKVKKLKEIHEPGMFLEYSRELLKTQLDNYHKLE